MILNTGAIGSNNAVEISSASCSVKFPVIEQPALKLDWITGIERISSLYTIAN